MEKQEQAPAGRTWNPPAQAVEQAQPVPRLLEQVRNVMRVGHYSIHTERSYVDWIKRYINFHHLRSRENLGKCSGAQVPERSQGIWLAIPFPITGAVHRPAERSRAAPSRGSDGRQSGNQGGGAAGRVDQSGERA